ncbi:hypothetical protein GUITHDRAFT_105932 [Guillardia theta CCMP2712]|uniref:Uncharacterized protein n=3 Tax=Guillardia theta TaxID=55529 RepID=L1JJS8_GUITC|nr:hypothetical protein GUITHDRAFT_105932 [Guillardia theta CCMP2712]EKX48325.1 hypothetical protein GUITHDRAFT_105932 [Guillardia theta CCMP2712]|eukprot:XP_005835305.1 hypothetical protein GUITHDRAFT_105932 [Guillardia theta CCMP2712]
MRKVAGMHLPSWGWAIVALVLSILLHLSWASPGDVLVTFHRHQGTETDGGCSWELLLCAAIVRDLSSSHGKVLLEMTEEEMPSFDRLFGDLHNVRPLLPQDLPAASSQSLEQELVVPSIRFDGSSLKLLGPGTSRALSMSCTDALYLELGRDPSERWSRWHFNRREEDERSVRDLFGIRPGERYIVSSSSSRFSPCREGNLTLGNARCLDVTPFLSSLVSILDMALLIEHAEELHLAYGPLALFADHLDLSQLAKRVVYMFGLDKHVMRDFKSDWIFADHQTTVASNHLVEFSEIECILSGPGRTWKCDVRFAVEPWLTGDDSSRLTIRAFGGPRELTRADLVRGETKNKESGEGCSFLVNSQRWQGCVVDMVVTLHDHLISHDVELLIFGTVGMKREQKLVLSRKLLVIDEDDKGGSMEENTNVVVFSSCLQGEECREGFMRLFPHLEGVTRIDWVIPQQVREEDFHDCSRSVQNMSSVNVVRLQSVFDFWTGYVIMMDDRLSYPAGYVGRMKSLIDKFDKRAMIGLEGLSLNQPLHGRRRAIDRDEVDLLRIGTTGFHTSVCYRDLIFKLTTVRHLFNSVDDVQVMFAWTSHVSGVPRIVIDEIKMPSHSPFSLERNDLFWTVSKDFLPRSRLPLVLDGEDEGWRLEPDRWRTWLHETLNNSAASMMRLNFPSLREVSAASAQGGGEEESIDLGSIPVVVMNQRHDSLRLQHVQQTLRRIGFKNLSIPPTISWKEVNLESLVGSGKVSANLLLRLDWYKDGDQEAKMKYLANAHEQVRIIKDAAEGEYPLLIFEDDVLPIAQDLRQVSVRLAEVLSQSPPSSDMIYLEFCYETCANVTYSHAHPLLARAFAPSCSAAIFYSVKGAKKISQLCMPVFDVIDRMYQFLIQTRLLEAYISLPPIFVQDRFWRSNVKKNAGSSLHAPLQPPCGGFDAARVFREVELRQEGLLLSPSAAASVARSGQPPAGCQPSASGWSTASVRYIFFAEPLELEQEMSLAHSILVYSDEEDGTLDVFLGTIVPGQQNFMLFAEEASSCFARSSHWSCVLRLIARGDGYVSTHQRTRVFLRACS